MKKPWIWMTPVFLFGCAVLSPVKTPKWVSIVVCPKVALHTQAIVPNYTLDSIATLSIIPHIETSPGIYSPISATTGNPTTPEATDVLRLDQASPSIDPARPFVIRRLKPNKNYRILGRAVDASNTVISKDDTSFVDVQVLEDDAPGMQSLPINLLNVPFDATTSVTVNTEGRFDYLQATLYLVAGNAQVGLSTTTQPNPEMQFGNLQSNTNYRLLLEAYKLGGVMASQSLDINVANDNAPATQSASLNVPYVVSTIAGMAGSSGTTNGTGNEARFNSPNDLKMDAAGNLYVAEYGGNLIRKIIKTNQNTYVVSTIAGSGAMGSANGTGTAAQFSRPRGLAVDGSGNLFVVDNATHHIRKIDVQSKYVSSIAGLAGSSGFANGTGTVARFNVPWGLGIDGAGNLYVVEESNKLVRKIEKVDQTNYVVSTIAGATGAGTFADGTGTEARLQPRGVVVDEAGVIYVADTFNRAIRKIEKIGSNYIVSTIAGAPGTSGTADGTGSAAQFTSPMGIAVDGSGNLYVTDGTNYTLRKLKKISPSTYVVSTIAGKVGVAGNTDGTGTAATLNYPFGVTVDAVGNLYVADYGGHTIRMVR